MPKLWPDPRDSKPESNWANGAIAALMLLGVGIQLYA